MEFNLESGSWGLVIRGLIRCLICLVLLQDTSGKTHTRTSNTPIELNSHRNPATPSGRVNPEVSPRYRSDELIAYYDISVVITSKYLKKEPTSKIIKLGKRYSII